MMLPVPAFKADVIEALKADAACAALFGARIYDEPPADARGDAADLSDSPWAFLDDVALRRLPTDCGPVFAVQMRIGVASTGMGRNEVWTAADAIAAALDHKTVSTVQCAEAEVEMAADEIGSGKVKTVFVVITAEITGAT